jgi:hypothetical protein
MLSLLNRTSAKNAPAPSWSWRPNFRNESDLPDIKTVRTKFFVNAVFIASIAVLAILIGFREVKISLLNTEIQELDIRISEIEKKYAKATADFKHFQTQEKSFNEAYALVKSEFSFPNFVLHIGSTLPKGVKVRRIDFRGLNQTINISGTVRGMDAAASNAASEFLKVLRTDQLLAKYFSSVNMPSLGRNVSEESMDFELVLLFAGATAKGGSK